jgi:hypothetical protein
MLMTLTESRRSRCVAAVPLTGAVTMLQAHAPRINAMGQPGHFGLWAGPAVPSLGLNLVRALFIILSISKFIFSD